MIKSSAPSLRTSINVLKSFGYSPSNKNKIVSGLTAVPKITRDYSDIQKLSLGSPTSSHVHVGGGANPESWVFVPRGGSAAGFTPVSEALHELSHFDFNKKEHDHLIRNLSFGFDPKYNQQRTPAQTAEGVRRLKLFSAGPTADPTSKLKNEISTNRRVARRIKQVGGAEQDLNTWKNEARQQITKGYFDPLREEAKRWAWVDKEIARRTAGKEPGQQLLQDSHSEWQNLKKRLKDSPLLRKINFQKAVNV